LWKYLQHASSLLARGLGRFCSLGSQVSCTCQSDRHLFKVVGSEEFKPLLKLVSVLQLIPGLVKQTLCFIFF
jgi:hypothetical protein